MIQLHINPAQPAHQHLRERLEKSSIRHKIIETRDSPCLEEGNEKVLGLDAIQNYLDQLIREVEYQRSLSADACYLDPETGETC